MERAIRYAQVQEMVARNVATLATVPRGGRPGRPSKSLTRDQAVAVLNAAKQFPRRNAYIALSLTSGVRTEEIRALRWSEVNTETDTVHVWRSVRDRGETKTRKSRRSLGLSPLAAHALRRHRVIQAGDRLKAGELWQDHGLVFCTQIGTPLDHRTVLREFRKVLKAAGLNEKE